MKSKDIDRRFESSRIFKLRKHWSGNVVLPFSPSIVDCFFLFKAISHGPNRSAVVERISNMGDSREHLIFEGVFDLYEAVREAEGREVLFVENESGGSIYLDEHERFVLVDGTEAFLQNARPYPDEIERHRYIESMLYLERDDYPVSPEAMYQALKCPSPTVP